MKSWFQQRMHRIIRHTGFTIIRTASPHRLFHSEGYLRHSARRLEHLASLRIPLTGMTVLELGAGIGDHSSYYIDRGCRITITDARRENVRFLKTRFPGQDIRQLDVDNPPAIADAPFDVVHCYGLLYHLQHPYQAIAAMSGWCRQMLFLETCVDPGRSEEVNPVEEDPRQLDQSVSGIGCRPGRRWVYEQLRRYFAHVYLPLTQPNHEEFPLDWRAPRKAPGALTRAVFIASRIPIANELLSESLVDVHKRL